MPTGVPTGVPMGVPSDDAAPIPPPPPPSPITGSAVPLAYPPPPSSARSASDMNRIRIDIDSHCSMVRSFAKNVLGSTLTGTYLRRAAAETTRGLSRLIGTGGTGTG